MRVVDVPIDKIYVPAAKKKTLDEEKIMPLAEDILENGQQSPILFGWAKTAMFSKKVCTVLRR